jgi:hypothetical protein
MHIDLFHIPLKHLIFLFRPHPSFFAARLPRKLSASA